MQRNKDCIGGAITSCWQTCKEATKFCLILFWLTIDAPSVSTFILALSRYTITDICLPLSVGQRAAKLLAFNVGGPKKKSAARPWPHSN